MSKIDIEQHRLSGRVIALSLLVGVAASAVAYMVDPVIAGRNASALSASIIGIIVFVFMLATFGLAILAIRSRFPRKMKLDRNELQLKIGRRSLSVPVRQCRWWSGSLGEDSDLAYGNCAQPAIAIEVLIDVCISRTITCGLDEFAAGCWVRALQNSGVQRIDRHRRPILMPCLRGLVVGLGLGCLDAYLAILIIDPPRGRNVVIAWTISVWAFAGIVAVSNALARWDKFHVQFPLPRIISYIALNAPYMGFGIGLINFGFGFASGIIGMTKTATLASLMWSAVFAWTIRKGNARTTALRWDR